MKKNTIKIFQFLGVFFLSLLVLEVFLRLAEIETVASTDFNSEIGRVKRSNFEYTFFNEGFSINKYNSHGFLGPEYAEKRPKDVIRIALVGDSYVEGYQVFERNHFRSILESKLNQKFDSVQILNFGRSGFDLADDYVYYKNFVSRYNPNIILFFFANSDLACTQTDPLIPRLSIQRDSLIIENNNYPNTALRTYLNIKFLVQNSAILKMLNDCKKIIKQGLFWPKILDKLYWKKINTEEEIQHVNKQDSNSNYLIENIVESLSNHQKEPKVIFIFRDKGTPNKCFLDQLNKYELDFININDTLDIEKAKGFDPNYWIATKEHGHWNNKTHSLIGYFLAKKLYEIIDSTK